MKREGELADEIYFVDTTFNIKSDFRAIPKEKQSLSL